MKVSEIMSHPVLTCTPDTWLFQAACLMASGNCGILPVVDSDGHVEGIITDRDICLGVAGSNRSPRAIRVHELMSRNVFAARADDDLPAALAKLSRAHVRRMPVLDASGHLTGLLSLDDIVLRGTEAGAVAADAIVRTMRALYERRPAPIGARDTAAA
jgi:CBS domain-containing protein